MHNNKGTVLIIALAFIAVLGILSNAFMGSSISENLTAQRYIASTRAFWLADAGIQKAKWEFDHNNCADFVQCGTATPCDTIGGCASCGDKCLSETLTANGDYDVTLDNTNSLLTSTGAYPSRTVANAQKRTIQM